MPASAVVDPEVPERLEARIQLLIRVIVDAVLEPLAADEAQPRAVRAAERGDRLGQLDRLANGCFDVELVMVGQAEKLIVAFFTGHDGMTGVEIDRGQCLLLDRDVDRDLDVADTATAFGGEAGVELGDDEEAAVRPREPDMPFDGVGQAEVVAEIDRGTGDNIVSGGPGLVVEEPGNVPDQRFDRRPIGSHRRTGSEASSSASSSSSPAVS